MDRFKFRIYDKHCKMYLPDGHYINGDKWMDDYFEDVYDLTNNMIVEQCTGLKDKNGNLIYEGDIVSDSVYENNFVVSWDNDRTGYVLSANNTNHIDYLSKILIERHNLKIIGNIHKQKD